MKNKDLVLLIILLPALLFCHKINIFATVEGNKIYTQSYASDGNKIKGGLIEVYDKAGNKLLSGETDSLGVFSFTIPKKDDLKIVVIGGMGHRAETIVSAEDLPEIKSAIVEKPQQKQKEKKEGIKTPQMETAAIDTTFLKKTIEDVLDTKLHPIIHMLAEQKEKRISFTEVIGGIGYIFGIMSIIFFALGRKKNV